MPWRVSHQPQNGHPATRGWSPTRRKCTTDMKFGTQTLLTKWTLVDNCHGWSPTIHWMLAHQPKAGRPQEGSVIRTWNLVHETFESTANNLSLLWTWLSSAPAYLHFVPIFYNVLGVGVLKIIVDIFHNLAHFLFGQNQFYIKPNLG